MTKEKVLAARPKIIFFTDFDGTITQQDTNDYITDHYGFGIEQRKQGMRLILDGKDTFRDGFQKMIDSWQVSLSEMIDILEKTITLDPHFKTFVHWAKEHQVPIIVVSSGMVPVIQALLKKLLGEELMKDIEVVANGYSLVPPLNDMSKKGGWNIRFRDDSGFGHDKSLTIRPYAEAAAELPESERPTLLYAGDGVSDLSAAKETDLLFAKAGNDLIIYCERENIPFTPFEDWSTILAETEHIYNGKDVKRSAREGLQRHRTNSMSRPRPAGYHRKMSISQGE